MFEDTNFFPQDGSSQSIVGGGVESVNSKKPDLKGNVSLNLSDLSEDSTHRTVTDEEKKKWNNTGEGGGGVAPTVDTTLSHAGQAADAKAVGDKIKTLNESLADYIKSADLPAATGEQTEEVGYNGETKKLMVKPSQSGERGPAGIEGFYSSKSEYPPATCLKYSTQATSWNQGELNEQQGPEWQVPGSIILLAIRCNNGDVYVTVQEVENPSRLKPRTYWISKKGKDGKDGEGGGSGGGNGGVVKYEILWEQKVTEEVASITQDLPLDDGVYVFTIYAVGGTKRTTYIRLIDSNFTGGYTIVAKMTDLNQYSTSYGQAIILVKSGKIHPLSALPGDTMKAGRAATLHDRDLSEYKGQIYCMSDGGAIPTTITFRVAKIVGG